MSKIRIFGVKLKQVAELLYVADEQVDDSKSTQQPPSDAHKSGAGKELNSGKQNPQIQKFPISETSTDGILEQPGSWIGRYKLLSVLGEGGMGVVYLAEQQHPFKRQVALKIIKPGMDSARIIARFEAEQQTLAMLAHPHVARIHDAGLTQSGRPYFVMEHVKGTPITEYCDNHKLTVEERLLLFLHVCQAIQYAHQKGIIHRDLKPSNILVTDNDNEAVPKVIDFGVARALSLPLTERTFYTEQGQFVGTPEYMSPEQVDPENQDIDTRTDVYSLGLVLYELLVGVLPFDPKTFREGGAECIRKIICEQDPATPSTRLRKTTAEESIVLALKRRSDMQTLKRKLRSDLDWITLKALEKDRMRRYTTVDALARDIHNYLSYEPVSAAPPAAVYRAGKFIRRHRQTLVVLGMTTLMLLAGLLIAIISVRAARERNYAQSLEHRDILTETQALAGNARYEQAQAKIGPLLNSPHVKRQAKLLQAQILLAQKQVVAAIAELESLLDEPDEVAGQAHFLLANIYYEEDPWSPEMTKQYQAKRQYHNQQAERLIAGTADYSFLQARASYDVRKRLEHLSRALKTDNSHYDSLRERAYIYYAQKDYSKMTEDASQMIVLRSGDSTGYLLRALARREQGRLDEAIADHNEAILRAPDDPTLYNHRSETYVRMGRYARALADARQAAKLDPDNLHYDGIVFSLKVACGQYEQARQQYENLLSKPGIDLEYSPYMPSMGRWNTKDFFDFITAGYTFLVLARQVSWRPQPEETQCAPLWAMLEAQEFYDQLSQRARCIIEEGFSPSWSPDGTKIAYSAGTHWASAVAIYNVSTGTTEILTAPGKDPQWSPDGRTIAFVRDRQSIAMNAVALIGHIPTTERRRTEGPLPTTEEVWVIDVASGEIRRIAEGSGPCWSPDSERVYFRLGGALYSASILANEPMSILIFERPCVFPAISPDGQQVAGANFRWLRIWDIDSGKVTLTWAAPPFPATGILFNWSPDGRELSIGGYPTCRMGLWILDTQTGQARRMLDGPIMTAAWSPDRSRMAIVPGPPHIEIWLAELDPNQPTAQALGDGATVEKHCRELIDYYSRGVAADPDYIDNYLRRTDAALWINDSRAPQFLKELEHAFQCTPYHAGGCFGRAQAILSSPAEIRDKLLPLALLLVRKAVEKEPMNPDFQKTLGEALYNVENRKSG
jgi:serine/threonine protein kinase/tetratricopeptide (TPR) repeat protein